MANGILYNELAWCYEFISTGEEHKGEAEFVKIIVKNYKKSKGNELLDVGCGHGWHDRFLKHEFKVTGVDLSNTILKYAKKRNPEVVYKQGDMRTFDLNKKFDIVMCFDAMQHNLNYKDLRMSIERLSEHLKDGGILIFHMDKLKENFKQYNISDSCQYTKGDVHVTFFEFDYDKDPNDTMSNGCLIFLIVKSGKEMEVRIVDEKMGLFELEKIKEILTDLGFKTILYSGDFSGKKYTKRSPLPVFVCVRKA